MNSGLKENAIRLPAPFWLPDRLTIYWRSRENPGVVVKDEMARTLPGYPWGHDVDDLQPGATSTQKEGFGG